MVVANDNNVINLMLAITPDEHNQRVRADQVPIVKQQKRTKPKKYRKKKAQHQKDRQQEKSKESSVSSEHNKEPEPEVEYIQENVTASDLEPMYRQFVKVFEAFKLEKPVKSESDNGEVITEYPPSSAVVAAQAVANKLNNRGRVQDDLFEDVASDALIKEDIVDENEKPKLSKRKLKEMSRLSVAELKQLVERPDLVEMHDVTARDPKLLLELKASRNSVEVPRHWCYKRKYLQGKRGIEKPPFQLPDFIARTGITEIRATLQEKEEGKTLKTKMKERARPKMGKIDIDYQKLHDAFFKWQTKPRLTGLGDLYYEGKEYETRMKEKKPGELSEQLRTALGMPVGPNCNRVPPPWLIAQQRYGPAPSYPRLKVPGLNSPLPAGCVFGYHIGGWGKPPVDQFGRPLYGDVFGAVETTDVGDEEVDRTHWGAIEVESSAEEDEDDDDDQDAAEKEDDSGLSTPVDGLLTPSGITSTPAGMETPEVIELRKKKIETEMDEREAPALYKVLQELRTEGMGTSTMGSTHVYDMTGAGGQAPPSVLAANRRGAAAGNAADNTSKRRKDEPVEVSLDPSELDMNSNAMASRYEETMRKRNGLLKEDVSDMLHDHVQRQKHKRKRQQGQQDPVKPAKKYKDFKF